MMGDKRSSGDIRPIGVVRTTVTDGIDEGWGDVESRIEIDPELADGLRGLDEFSHALVIFLMDRSTFQPASDLVRRPQGREDMPLVGIFAQRAKHRPNPIGVTAVRIIGMQGNILRVIGLDAIDGTPVLDIKPYFPQFDAPADPRTPEWVVTLMERYF
ncbi:MAG: hypothetical protein JWQ98_135 [Chlorobi bacterium]|nr:hypothetical protein [Chlorobiota bacterium]